MGADLEGSAEKCRVVATRANGEQVVISHHLSHQMAERAVSLMRHGSNFESMRIEDEPADAQHPSGE